MSLTYYVALPFVRSDDGTAPGQAMELGGFGRSRRSYRSARWHTATDAPTNARFEPDGSRG